MLVPSERCEPARVSPAEGTALAQVRRLGVLAVPVQIGAAPIPPGR
jgi:hypothetical protein